MRRTTIRTMVLVLIAVGLAGCQSGPQWASSLAWWKHDAPPEDTSLVARSAAPELPSAQVAPPQVSSAAMPPSAANLAAASTPPTVPAATMPQVPMTPAGMPVASYPTTAAAATIPPVAAAPQIPATATSPYAMTPAPAVPNATAGVPNAATVAQTGPYDPNAYRPTTTPTTLATVASDDRYGAGSGSAQADRYAATPAVGQTPPVGDRYAAVPDRYQYEATPPAASAPTPPAPATAPYGDDRYGVAAATPAAGMPTAQYPVSEAVSPAMPASATVQITSPAGQYRPGGTASYPVRSASDEVEVATRPSPPATTLPSMPTNQPVPATYPATTPPNGMGAY